ncbi:MAG: methyltransferase domain-containing protein [bacterium]|nr:methyltransferase domain-containing protein [bacterium]
MNKQKLKEEILKITDWRHPFQLETGEWVKMLKDWYIEWHPWRVKVLMPNIEKIAQHAVPGGFKNARVLDIGCWDGYYGYQFLKRGAKHLKGIDLRDEAIRRATLLKDYYGYENCEFEKRNIQDKKFQNEQYDISLLYGVIYHLSAPIDVVKTLGNITTSMLLVNTYATPHKEAVLKLKREDPEKDSAGFQELITRPSESALVEMLNFAGFDIILRDYPYPFYERYRNSTFGFFYGIKSSIGQEKIDQIFKDLNVQETYNPKLKQPQIVRLKLPEPENGPLSLKKRVGLKLHCLIDKLFQD